MSTHYSLPETNIIMDGVSYPLDKVNVSIAFGGDLSHPYTIDFGMKANGAAYDAIKPGCVVEVGGIKGVVDIVNTNYFVLSVGSDALVTIGVTPLRELV